MVCSYKQYVQVQFLWLGNNFTNILSSYCDYLHLHLLGHTHPQLATSILGLWPLHRWLGMGIKGFLLLFGLLVGCLDNDRL